MLSPVTMRTVMPARWHVATASGTSLRTGSCGQGAGGACTATAELQGGPADLAQRTTLSLQRRRCRPMPPCPQPGHPHLDAHDARHGQVLLQVVRLVKVVGGAGGVGLQAGRSGAGRGGALRCVGAPCACRACTATQLRRVAACHPAAALHCCPAAALQCCCPAAPSRTPALGAPLCCPHSPHPHLGEVGVGQAQRAQAGGRHPRHRAHQLLAQRLAGGRGGGEAGVSQQNVTQWRQSSVG